jgi:prepilin-type N-terminal cleavage/methylation domain-containing protein
MRNRLKDRGDKGFTLVELLIVLIILAILSGLVVFAVGAEQQNAAFATCATDAKAVQSALQEYKAMVGAYPGGISLQVTGPSNPNPQPLTGDGQNIYGTNPQNGSPNQTLISPNVGGLLGLNGGSWTAPDGVVVGPFLRQLPSTQHYQIVTDGQGEVFVYPPPAPGKGPGDGVDVQSHAMQYQQVEYVTDASSDTAYLNFEEDPGICSDPNIVQ